MEESTMEEHAARPWPRHSGQDRAEPPWKAPPPVRDVEEEEAQEMNAMEDHPSIAAKAAPPGLNWSSPPPQMRHLPAAVPATAAKGDPPPPPQSPLGITWFADCKGGGKPPPQPKGVFHWAPELAPEGYENQEKMKYMTQEKVEYEEYIRGWKGWKGKGHRKGKDGEPPAKETTIAFAAGPPEMKLYDPKTAGLPEGGAAGGLPEGGAAGDGHDRWDDQDQWSPYDNYDERQQDRNIFYIF